MHHLSIDLETYSSVPIAKAGAQKYISSPDFEILLFAYSVDGAPVEIIDLARGERLPPWLVQAITSPEYIKHAYNAPFEWGCLSKFLGTLPPDQWRCTMFHGLYCGYTAGLDATGKALGLAEDKRKLNTGKALIRYFCVPCAPTKANGGRTRNLPQHDTDKWELFKEYCRQDVVTEMEIERRLSAFPVPDFVQKQWETDLIINARGVAVDMDLVSGALYLGNVTRQNLTQEAMKISKLDNPNSVAQLTQWLQEAMGEELADLRKDTVARLLGKEDNSPQVQRMLEIRQELGKTSTKKYDAIEAAVCPDGRVRGLLQFYGANRTGRWAGRLVQVQNLPRTYTEPLPLARELVEHRKLDALRLIYGSVPDTLSQLIRTAFVAPEGHVLIDADFSAIEARVISWLAGEQWRLEVFRTHGKIYEASASQMFGVPIELIKKGNPEYVVQEYDDAEHAKDVVKVEVMHGGGVDCFIRTDDGVLEPDSFAYSGPYIITRQDDETGKVEGYNWERIPLVCFKSSHHEIPLLSKVKCLQDAYNNILSNFANQMEEDIHTTILVIKNYDGEDLGTFRRNLATYGAIKVRSYEGAEGGVDTLEISVNAENYKTLLALLKDAIIENARGYDAKDDRMSGDPNQMNIQSMYSDIDLDANGIEMEFQASMEELLWFINKHLANTGGRSFEGEDVTVIFDRDVLINETEVINNCKNSVGILSDETIVKMHPWVTDPEQELQRIKDEKEEAMQADPYQAAFLANRNQPPVNNEGGGDGKTD